MPLPIEPSSLAIESIQARAQAYGFSVHEVEPLSFVSSLDTLDLQAAPGCGKTTLTGLKLCLMATGWASETRGVCILSHTNVAKDQIIDILQRDNDGRRFLSYPHFIGTIQSFVDTFFAKPYLNSTGVDLRAIDDGVFQAAVRSRLHNAGNLYKQLNNLINPPNPRQDVKEITYTAHYVWEGGTTVVKGYLNGSESNFPFGSHTASAQQFMALKDAISSRGIYTFHDMYALARKHLALHPQLKNATRYRFPFVLIDEMQDTNHYQEQFLNDLFDSPDCVLQRIGDVNQRIYSEATDNETASAQFPKMGHTALPRSMRFGGAIASASSPLTIEAPQILLGNEDRPAFPPRLILFEEASIDQVIPRFAQDVSANVPAEDLERFPVKAIGARKSGAANEFPKRIQCYWPDYNPDPARARKATKLIHAVLAIRSRPKMPWKERSDLLWDACCELLMLWGYKVRDRRPTPSRLSFVLSQLEFERANRVRKAVLHLNVVDVQSEGSWNAAILELRESLHAALDLPIPTSQSTSYAEYGVQPPTDEESAKCEMAPITVGQSMINVELATIHAVKGETHAATLVLECFHHVHDLKEVLPMIVARHDAERLQTVQSIRPAARRIFVGMTRPRSLLALAVRKSHIVGLIPEFEAAGWEVIDLT